MISYFIITDNLIKEMSKYLLFVFNKNNRNDYYMRKYDTSVVYILDTQNIYTMLTYIFHCISCLSMRELSRILYSV